MRTAKIAAVLLGALTINLLVFIVRLWLTHQTASAGILADAFHALADGFSSIIALTALWLVAKPPDRRHPRGHHPFEHRAVITIGILIVITGVEVARTTIEKAVGGYAPLFSWNALSILLGTMLMSIVLAAIEHRLGKRYNSLLLLADAKHTVSDALAGLSVLIGYGTTALNIAAADLAAGFLVSGIILSAGVALITTNARPCTHPNHQKPS